MLHVVVYETDFNDIRSQIDVQWLNLQARDYRKNDFELLFFITVIYRKKVIKKIESKGFVSLKV